MDKLPAWLAATLRRWWWIAALVTLVTLFLAAYGYASTRPIYVATQHLTIVLLPPDGATATEVARTEQDEQAIARLLVQGNIFASRPLDAAIAAQLASHGGQGAGISASNIATAVLATHTGNMVTVSARWSSPGGARALVTATAAALADGALQPSAAQAGDMPPGASLRVEVDVPPGQAVVDEAVAGMARGLLLGRIALGVVAGLVLAVGAGLLRMRAAVAGSTR
jgi:hypothetical protein